MVGVAEEEKEKSCLGWGTRSRNGKERHELIDAGRNGAQQHVDVKYALGSSWDNGEVLV